MARFLADVMLGSLARWLRILGYDAAYDNRIDDDEIIGRSRAEGRIALTRNTRLVHRLHRVPHLLVQGDDLVSQICQVLDYLGERIDSGRLLTRCVECNTLLEPISKQAVRERVPSYVYRTQPHFKHCPSCRRIYWGGTHREQILKLAALVEQTSNRTNEQTRERTRKSTAPPMKQSGGK